jgi:hypothetical protein
VGRAARWRRKREEEKVGPQGREVQGGLDRIGCRVFLFSFYFKTVLVFESKTIQNQTIFKTVKHLK